jgi:hypothetical protein
MLLCHDNTMIFKTFLYIYILKHFFTFILTTQRIDRCMTAHNFTRIKLLMLVLTLY